MNVLSRNIQFTNFQLLFESFTRGFNSVFHVIDQLGWQMSGQVGQLNMNESCLSFIRQKGKRFIYRASI